MRSTTTTLLSALLLATVVIAGCSSDEETPSVGWAIAPPTSGTRLRAKVINGGGVREIVGFRDVERNEDCTFRKAEDGRIRCLPPTIVASPGLFSDPTCQTPLVIGAVATCVGAAAAPAEVIKYAIVNRSDGTCGTQIPTEIRRVVPIDPATPRYNGAPGSSCNLQQLPPGSTTNTTASTLGEVVPWTAFVEATETVVAGEAASEKVLVSPDGARQHFKFRSDKLDADCAFQVMSDGITRCVPNAADGASGGVTYLDAECTQAAFVTDFQSSGPCAKGLGRIWIEPKGVACGGIKSIYSLGGSFSTEAGGRFFSMQPTSGRNDFSLTCTEIRTALPSGSSTTLRSIEADVTPSLPKTARVGGGGGRLVPALVSNPASSGNHLEPGFHDNERDVDCTFTLASDNKLRCLPTASPATIFFTDTSCKSPAVVAVLTSTPCVAGAKLARVVSSSCPPTTRVFSLGTTPRDLTEASTQVTPERCPTFTSVRNAFDATEVDVAGFVEGVLTTE